MINKSDEAYYAYNFNTENWAESWGAILYKENGWELERSVEDRNT